MKKEYQQENSTAWSILNANLVVIHELEQGLKLEQLLSENPKRMVTGEHIDAEEKFGKKLYLIYCGMQLMMLM